jgi:Uma2 family endonuclease
MKMVSTALERLRRHRLTVSEYLRMGEVRILAPDARVELIEGEIFDMAPIGSLHAGTVTRLGRMLERAVGDTALVYIQNPVALSNYSAPQPDLALLRPREDFYTASHPGPTDVLLMIEVADTTLRDDREVKAPLYAAHGVPEYWIVDLEGKGVHVFREPLSGQYRQTFTAAGSEALVPAELPHVRIKASLAGGWPSRRPVTI